MPVSRRVRILLIVTVSVFLCLGIIVAVLVMRFQPVARDYILAALRDRYKSEVELGALQISLFPRVRATGENLIFHFAGRKDQQPLVKVRRFTLEARFIGFFRNPKRIRILRLEGLEIHLPPKSGGGSSNSGKEPRVPFVLDEVIANGASLDTTPKDPSKKPLRFDISELTMHSVGVGSPMTFHAKLTNPKPPGFIHSDGQFGPWNADEPADTPVSGKYTFRDADLSVFKGITGTLASEGRYSGQLSRLEVAGAAEVPNFTLRIGDNPVPLHLISRPP